jgi:hypothetical protein
MVAVASPGIDAGMWLPARHFALDHTNSRSPQAVFKTIGLVMPDGFDLHGD